MNPKAAPHIILGGLLALIATPISAQSPRKGPQQNFTLPSDIIAREMAFKRLTLEKGTGPALKEFAQADALISLGQGTRAQSHFADHAAPPPEIKELQTRQVWMSCDGSLAAAIVSADSPTSAATHIWQRDRKGQYRLIALLPAANAKPEEFIDAKVADCPKRGEIHPLLSGKAAPQSGKEDPFNFPPNPPIPDGLADYRQGKSDDASLAWAIDGNTTLIWLRQGEKLVSQFPQP